MDIEQKIAEAVLDIAHSGVVGEKHARNVPMRDIHTVCEGVAKELAPILRKVLGDDADKKLLDAYYDEE